MSRCHFSFFFFNDTATTEIYTLSLHDALPICIGADFHIVADPHATELLDLHPCSVLGRSEEHTSELQSPCNLVCRLLLEKKKTNAAQPLRTGRSHSTNLCNTSPRRLLLPLAPA